jgi:hypothetical protein
VKRAHSSAVERYVDIVEVTGSNPVVPTTCIRTLLGINGAYTVALVSTRTLIHNTTLVKEKVNRAKSVANAYGHDIEETPLMPAHCVDFLALHPLIKPCNCVTQAFDHRSCLPKASAQPHTIIVMVFCTMHTLSII